MKRALLLLVLVASTAHADKPDKTEKQKRAEAALMYERASAHYQAGRFSDAIPLFREAYELVHDPVYLFNLAQSYRKVLDCESASVFYERYLTEATDADAKQKERVQGWLRELAPCVVERKRAAEAAIQARTELEAAERARQEADAKRNAKPTYKTVDAGRNLRIAGYIAGGVGLAGITLGVIYGVKGANIEDELRAECEMGCNWGDPATRDKDEAGKRANTISVISYVTGGAALAGGVALYFWGRTKTERVQVMPTAGGATVSARLSF